MVHLIFPMLSNTSAFLKGPHGPIIQRPAISELPKSYPLNHPRYLEFYPSYQFSRFFPKYIPPKMGYCIITVLPKTNLVNWRLPE